jgi:hypothetical protein
VTIASDQKRFTRVMIGCMLEMVSDGDLTWFLSREDLSVLADVRSSVFAAEDV